MTAIEFRYKLIDLQAGLLKFAYKLTTNTDEARDLVQETFLKALKHSDKFVYDSNFKAWIYTILKNTFINNYNRSVNHNTFSDQTADGYYINYIQASDAYNPHSTYSSKEIEKTIDTLDDTFKLPFKMRTEGFKYKEIAETLDLNIGTVKSRIFLAKQKLIKKLNK
jgi:RNA polymerase sigma-70 factor (ECF subfamily)